MSVMDNGFTFKTALRETSRKIDKIMAMVAARSGDAHCIEYLESTGTQFINANIGYFADFEVDIRLRESVPNRALGINSANCLQRINQQSPYWRFTAGGGNTDTNVSILERHVMAWKSGKIMADGIVLVSKSKPFSTGAFQLFGAYNSGFPNMIYGCRLYDSSSILVRDFIPMRVGTVGYMLDLVSGKLFENKGTGNFVLGPDV